MAASKVGTRAHALRGSGYFLAADPADVLGGSLKVVSCGDRRATASLITTFWTPLLLRVEPARMPVYELGCELLTILSFC